MPAAEFASGGSARPPSPSLRRADSSSPRRSPQGKDGRPAATRLQPLLHPAHLSRRFFDAHRFLSVRILADVIDAGGDKDGEGGAQIVTFTFRGHVDRPDLGGRTTFDRCAIFTG